jgi:aconitate hydratase
MSYVNPFNTLKTLHGKYFYSLKELEKHFGKDVASLPVSIKIILESLLRNCDGKKIKEEDIERLAYWQGVETSQGEAPFVVSRVLLQDFTGVPLLVDLAAMRDAVKKIGEDPKIVEPLVPVDLIIDHSVQVDRSGTEDAFDYNLALEFQRNRERYAFLKWGQQAFKTFKVFPPGMGICHQVNLEFLGEVVSAKEYKGHQVLFFDTLVGTDSHTTMINGLGIVGWGVGGIEGEAAMLGQPLALEIPQVIGLHLKGRLNHGVTPTDLTLRITELLRKTNVVGKFVEFFGEGAASLSVTDRAMIANMAPEYGATMGFFPADKATMDYLLHTGRDPKKVHLAQEYLQEQGVFGMPQQGQLRYTKVIELDLETILPSVAGPKRPQDRINLEDLKEQFSHLLHAPVDKGGYGKDKLEPNAQIYIHSDGTFSLYKTHATGGVEEEVLSPLRHESEMVMNRPLTKPMIDPGYTQKHSDRILSDGSVVIAAITSCTNTSNPFVMIAAGLLAKNAYEKGLKVPPLIKTSLAPGSRVVTDYLEKTGLQIYLDKLGFQLVAYGCTTCIGNSGPLDERVEEAIKKYDLAVASVLSGNRNFEARVHSSVKANFLMSPPLVIAFALAGKVNIDLECEPLGYSHEGKPVYLKEIWPEEHTIHQMIAQAVTPELFKNRYQQKEVVPIWENIKTSTGITYHWDKASTYIQNPPYFEGFSLTPQKRPSLEGMRALALLGDSVTTDHISPAGSFKQESPAGKYLTSLGVQPVDFNSYGSRRGNHEVMMRGTFANVRIKNKMAKGKEGGYTLYVPSSEVVPIYEAAMEYQKHKVPLIVFAGSDYGMGSSRDWAAKGSNLLGVKVIVAKSFERIHRSNLVGMGVLPLQFLQGESIESLAITGEEVFSLYGLKEQIVPKQEVTLQIQHQGKLREIKLLLRIDTPIEVEYYLHGGIMPYVLRQIMQSA